MVAVVILLFDADGNKFFVRENLTYLSCSLILRGGWRLLVFIVSVIFFPVTVHFGAAESYSMHQLQLLDKFLRCLFL